MTPHEEGNWNSLQWRRRLERFGEDDGPVIATGAGGEVDGIWYCYLEHLAAHADEGTANWASSQTKVEIPHMT